MCLARGNRVPRARGIRDPPRLGPPVQSQRLTRRARVSRPSMYLCCHGQLPYMWQERQGEQDQLTP